jgi:hypothetical protein
MERSGNPAPVDHPVSCWYLAECQICVPIQPAPFRAEVIRDRLADFHAKHYGHEVAIWAEIGGRW